LGLEDSVKLAMAHNKMLQQTMEEREAARGGVVGSRSAYLPSVGVTGQYQRLDEVSSFEIDTPEGKQTLQLGDVDNYSIALTVTQPIYAGGAISARVRAARLMSLYADQTVRAATRTWFTRPSRPTTICC
jgi:outer membrane protein TolC